MSLWEINDPPLSPCLQLALSPASWSWSWRHLCPAWVLVLGSNRRAASCLAAVITVFTSRRTKIFLSGPWQFFPVYCRRSPGTVTCLENVNILFSTALNNGHSDERHLTSDASSSSHQETATAWPGNKEITSHVPGPGAGAGAGLGCERCTGHRYLSRISHHHHTLYSALSIHFIYFAIWQCQLCLMLYLLSHILKEWKLRKCASLLQINLIFFYSAKKL